MQDDQLRVLVVDDSEHHRQILTAILESQGLIVDSALDGSQAVIRAKAIAFDLILMDVNMPVMNGWTATELIRRQEVRDRRRRTPLYIISSQSDDTDIARSHAAGADGHIAKPAPLSCVLDLIDGCAEGRERKGGGDQIWDAGPELTLARQ